MKKKGLLLILVALVCLLFALPNNKEANAAEEEGTWTIVNDISELVIGDKVIVVAASADQPKALGNQTSNNRSAVNITKDGNTAAIGDSVQILTLENGKSTGTYAFNTGDGYLYAASSSNNYLRTETSLSANSSWTISISSTGVATIKAQGTNSRNWLRFNPSSSLFSCYTSGQQDVAIYKFKVPTTWEKLQSCIYYYYNEGVYTKDTIINIDPVKVGAELSDLVHAYNIETKIDKTKTTRYNVDQLTFDNGRGYGTSDDGKLTTIVKNSETNNFEVQTVHNNLPGMEEYYCTLHDFYEGKHSSAHVDGNELDLSTGWVVDENGVYTNTKQENPDVIAAFALFTAPTWLNLNDDYSKYMDYTKVTIQINEDGNLVMTLWVSQNEVEGKLDDISVLDNSGENAVFSEAIIYDPNINDANNAAKEIAEMFKETTLINADYPLPTTVSGYRLSEVEWSGTNVDGNTLKYIAPTVDTTESLTATITIGNQVRIVEGIQFIHLLKESTGLVDKQYQYTFNSKIYSANGAQTLNGVTWTAAGDGNYWGKDSTKGQQFGSGSKPYKSLTLTSDSFENVTSIKINTSGASSTNAKLTVTVDGVKIGSTISLTDTATEYTFTAPEGLTGPIVLTYSQTSSKAIYIKSITVAYAVAE